MITMQRLFKGALGIALLGLLICISALAEKRLNLGKEPSMRKWIHKKFELQEGVYLYKYQDSPRDQLYLRNHQDKNVYGNDKADEVVYYSQEWGCMLDPGTQFEIMNIYVEKVPLVGDFFIIEAVLLNGKYNQKKVKVTELFQCDSIEPFSIKSVKDSISPLN